jgi:hypothetical protein
VGKKEVNLAGYLFLGLIQRDCYVRTSALKNHALTASAAILIAGLVTGCDEEKQYPTGGGPGSSDPVDVTATGNGFCDPSQTLSDPSLVSNPTSARIDSDGNPAAQGQDPSWNPLTSGSVNGKPVNAATYNYAVLSRQQAAASGAVLGDWIRITNTSNGQSTWSRYEDTGPDGNAPGELSEAAATSLGIAYLPSTATIGDPQVSFAVYSGSASVEGSCNGNSNLSAQN